MRRPVHIMAKPTGATCNLDCSYCYYLRKETSTPAAWRMSAEVLEAYIKQFLALHPGPEVTFAWQGGEPTLMGLDTFHRILELQEHYRSAEQRVTNTLQTNGTLLDQAWADFLRDNIFLVGISLDGPEDLHDRNRVDKGGRPTFRRVLAAIDLLRRNQVEYNLLCTVNAANGDHGARVYRFLREHAEHLQFIPVVERPGDPDPSWPGDEVTPWSVGSDQFGRFLNDVFDVWFAEDVGRIHVQLFEIQVAMALGQPAGLCVFNETCGDALVLERDGSLYSCDHYVYDTFKLGDIRRGELVDLADREVQHRFGRAKRDTLPRQCRSCRHLRRCHGECPKHRFTTTRDGENGLSYLCSGYDAFYEHCGPRIDAMAAGLRRGVPAWDSARNWGGRPLSRKAGPNDPCPCGSGRKHKKCCR